MKGLETYHEKEGMLLAGKFYVGSYGTISQIGANLEKGQCLLLEKNDTSSKHFIEKHLKMITFM